MNATELIIQKVPDQFSRKDIMNTAKDLGYSYSTATGVVEKMLYQDLAERIRPGLYQKLEDDE